MPTPPSELRDLVQRDPRYPLEAYAFVGDAYRYTLHLLKLLPKKAEEFKPVHVTGQQLCDGLRALAQREYGLMAKSVLHRWGIRSTNDVGNVVFNLIEAGLMGKRPEDSPADFDNVFDLDAALDREYEIKMDESE